MTLAVLVPALASGQVIGIGSSKPARRQPAPAAERLPASDIIEPDALRLLTGPRPDFTGQRKASNTAAPLDGGSSRPWSALVSGATLADEIKLAMPTLKQATETQTAFDSNLVKALDQFFVVSVAFGLMAASQTIFVQAGVLLLLVFGTSSPELVATSTAMVEKRTPKR